MCAESGGGVDGVFIRFRTCYEVTFCQVEILKNHSHPFFSLNFKRMGTEKESQTQQFPALATLLYVDQISLPTGQWYASNPTVS